MLKLIPAKYRRLKSWISQKWEDYQYKRFNIESYDRNNLDPLYFDEEECGCDKCNCKKKNK
jgi:hypothetical protein